MYLPNLQNASHLHLHNRVGVMTGKGWFDDTGVGTDVGTGTGSIRTIYI